MKKKIMGFIAIVAIAAVAGYNVYNTNKLPEVTNLMLANIEALALPGDEIGPAPGNRYACGYNLSYGGVGTLRACESCVPQFFVKYALRYGYCG